MDTYVQLEGMGNKQGRKYYFIFLLFNSSSMLCEIFRVVIFERIAISLSLSLFKKPVLIYSGE